jgi:hypothetical protein
MFLDKNILKNRILNKKFQPNSLTTSLLQKKKKKQMMWKKNQANDCHLFY